MVSVMKDNTDYRAGPSLLIGKCVNRRMKWAGRMIRMNTEGSRGELKKVNKNATENDERLEDPIV